MNICFYKPAAGTFNADTGGVQRITQTLKSELEKLGVKVWLCTTQPNHKDTSRGSAVIYLPDNKEDSIHNKVFLNDWLIQEKIDVFINQLAYSSETQSLMEVVSKSNTKLINVHHNCISCLYEHFPHIFRSNSPDWLSKAIGFFGLWSVVKTIFKISSKRKWLRAINQSDAFVLYFDSFVNELKDFYKIESKQVKVITNPAFFDSLRESELSITKRIVYVGRIVENQKRIDKLLKVWKRLHTELPDWNFDLVGDGSYMERAKEFIEKHQLDRVAIHGFREPKQYWLGADVFTLTSDYEGFGLVLVEAQAFGTVPVAFNCFSAISEVINNGESGVIVSNYDEDAMVNEVLDLVRNPHVLMDMKKAGLKKTQDFDKTLIASQWYSLLLELNPKN